MVTTTNDIRTPTLDLIPSDQGVSGNEALETEIEPFYSA